MMTFFKLPLVMLSERQLMVPATLASAQPRRTPNFPSNISPPPARSLAPTHSRASRASSLTSKLPHPRFSPSVPMALPPPALLSPASPPHFSRPTRAGTSSPPSQAPTTSRAPRSSRTRSHRTQPQRNSHSRAAFSRPRVLPSATADRKSTRLNSSHSQISY